MHIPIIAISLLLTVSTQAVRIGEIPTMPNGIVTEPRLIHFTRPEYTAEARRRGVEGTVTVQAEFDANGNFKILRVLKGLGHGLDESALAALQNWRFAPAYRNGSMVSVIAQIDVAFSLNDDKQRLMDKLHKSLDGLHESMMGMQKLREQLKAKAKIDGLSRGAATQP
jgi:TonB family protein